MRQLPQQKLQTWSQIVDFLGGLWVDAMRADEAAGTDLPDEVHAAICKVADAIAEAAAAIGKYRASN